MTFLQTERLEGMFLKTFGIAQGTEIKPERLAIYLNWLEQNNQKNLSVELHIRDQSGRLIKELYSTKIT